MVRDMKNKKEVDYWQNDGISLNIFYVKYYIANRYMKILGYRYNYKKYNTDNSEK